MRVPMHYNIVMLEQSIDFTPSAGKGGNGSYSKETTGEVLCTGFIVSV